MSIDQVQRTVSTRLPTAEGEFQLVHYNNAPDQKEHLALVMGDPQDQQNVLVRVHSECFTGDVLGSRRCDCGEQLHIAMQRIADEGQGVIIYLRHEGRGIGLQKKLEAYNLQDQGHDTVDANLLLGHQADERTYEVAVAILHDLGIQSLRLLTNNPHKLEQLRASGLTITDRLPIEPTVHAGNHTYLATKVERMRHLLALPPTAASSANGLPTNSLPNNRMFNGGTDNGGTASNGANKDSPQSSTASPTAELVADLTAKAAAYFSAHQLPFVTLSYAQSIDGSIAAANGCPLRISGNAAMTLTHALRAAHDAILVGVGTVVADDPQLTVRLVKGRDPQPIILDTHLRTPPHARCLHNQRRPWLATTVTDPAQHSPFLRASAQLLTGAVDKNGYIAMHPLLEELAARGIRSIMVEGGATVIRHFLQASLAQAAVITIAPFFIGGLPAIATTRAETTDTVPTPASFPRLATPQFLQLDDDIICYGHFTDPAAAQRKQQPKQLTALP